MRFRAKYQTILSTAGAEKVGIRLQVLSILMLNSVARSAVKGENGPEHPNSGFGMPRLTTKRSANLV